MGRSKALYPTAQPMRIQARKGSLAERRYRAYAALPGAPLPAPKAIAPGISPAPLEDLIFHGGKIVPKMEFQNVYLGSTADWVESDITSIDAAIAAVMRHKNLNNVMVQYFLDSTLSCDTRASIVLNDATPTSVDEPDVQAKIVELYDQKAIARRDLGTTIFNLILPPGATLHLDSISSLNGLGGYHGSVHIKRGGKAITLYYSANVFSQMLSSTRENGIVVFNRPWKNVVATLCHEINEFRTDADVNDAIQTNDNDFLGWMSRRGQECGDQPIIAASTLSQVFKQIAVASGKKKKVPVQFMYSNAVHGAEGPIPAPHA